jgi:hypothetical protein
MLAVLVKYKANLNAREGYAIRLACSRNQIDLVRYLISNGADVHAEQDDCLRLGKAY